MPVCTNCIKKLTAARPHSRRLPANMDSEPSWSRQALPTYKTPTGIGKQGSMQHTHRLGINAITDPDRNTFAHVRTCDLRPLQKLRVLPSIEPTMARVRERRRETGTVSGMDWIRYGIWG